MSRVIEPPPWNASGDPNPSRKRGLSLSWIPGDTRHEGNRKGRDLTRTQLYIRFCN